jgi:hypothetical protein
MWKTYELRQKNKLPYLIDCALYFKGLASKNFDVTTVLDLYRPERRYTARVPQFRKSWHLVLLEALASEDTEEEIFPIFFFTFFFFWKGREESLYIEDLWGSSSRKGGNVQKGAGYRRQSKRKTDLGAGFSHDAIHRTAVSMAT